MPRPKRKHQIGGVKPLVLVDPAAQPADLDRHSVLHDPVIEPPRKRGRPKRSAYTSRMSQKVVDEICRLAALGVPDVQIAGAIGIGKGTLFRWKSMGRNERQRIEDGGEPDPLNEQYLTFINMYDRATNVVNDAALTLIKQRIEEGDSDIAKWWLERRLPEQFAATRRVQVTGGDGDKGAKNILVISDNRAAMLQLAGVETAALRLASGYVGDNIVDAEVSDDD